MCSVNISSFVLQLLKKNPEERLGGGKDDSRPIKVGLLLSLYVSYIICHPCPK